MSDIQFVDIGFSNFAEVNKILTVSRPDSSPIKRLVQHAKDRGNFIDLTQGKKTRSIIIQKAEHGIVITASAVQPSTIIQRIRRAKINSCVVDKVSNDVIETSLE